MEFDVPGYLWKSVGLSGYVWMCVDVAGRMGGRACAWMCLDVSDILDSDLPQFHLLILNFLGFQWNCKDSL